MIGNYIGMLRDIRYVALKPKLIKNICKSFFINMILPGGKRPCLMFFHTTYRCNAKCKYCSAASMMKSPRKLLTKEEKTNVIRDAKDMGVFRIHFTGGEPLLDPDLYELIETANPDETLVSLVTNGLLLKKHAERLKKARLTILGISIDSPDPEKHDELRGVDGLFNAAMEGIEEARKWGLPLHISNIATHESMNNGDIERMMKLAESLGADLNITYIRKSGTVVSDTPHHLFFTEKDWEKLFDLQKKRKLRFDMLGNWRKTRCCAAGLERISLNGHGDVIPCDFIQMSFGNIREESLSKIWERMVNNNEFFEVKDMCRMYDDEFIEKYMDKIYSESDLPVSWKKLENLKLKNGTGNE